MDGRFRLTQTPARTLGIFGLAFALATCGGDTGRSPTDPVRMASGEVEFESFQLINDARSEEGAQPQLALEESLSGVARSHSEAMRDRGFFGHVDPEGNALSERLRGAQVSFSKAAENIVRVDSRGNPAADAHNLLMTSGGHRDNILNPDFRLAGVGTARRDDTYWITQVFIEP